jgi:protoheme IX farnesyltransferase
MTILNGWKLMKTTNSAPFAPSGTDQYIAHEPQNRLKSWQGLLLRLHAAKNIISLFVALSSLTGYVVAAGRLDSVALTVFSGILLLAAGSATLNNLQDRYLDRRFTRTSGRPLACGALTVAQGKRQSVYLMAAGCLLLYLSPNGLLLVLLGLTAVACYNLLYTPFKMRTLWAVIPGVVCGMIPPLVGWTAAGGHLGSQRIWLIMILLGLWQPPHAWMILLANSEEVRASGSRNLLHLFSATQVGRIVFAWVCSFMAILALLPLFGILHHSFFSFSLVLAGVLTIGSYGWGLFISRSKRIYRHLFILLNSVLAIAMLYCIIENSIAT